MAKYYYNGAEILAPFTVQSNEPMFDVDTVSLKKQRSSQNVQRWEISFNTMGTSETQQNIFINSVSGIDSISTMIMPQLPSVAAKSTMTQVSPLASIEEAPIGSSASVDDSIVYVNASNRNGFIPKGAFIKFSNKDKIYTVTADVDLTNSNATSLAMNIYPKLRKALTTSDNVLVGDSVILNYWVSIDNMRGISFSDGVLSSAGTITLIEAV